MGSEGPLRRSEDAEGPLRRSEQPLSGLLSLSLRKKVCLITSFKNMIFFY